MALKKTIFYYSAVTQFTNAGDALINRELISLMKKHGEIQAILGKAPREFIDEIGLSDADILRGGLMELLWAAMRSRASGHRVFLVQTPGDMVGGSVKISTLVRTLAVMVFHLIGIKVLQVGASLGKLSKWELRLFAFRTRFMKGLGLRDPISIATANKANFSNVFYFPDLAFGLQCENQKKSKYDIPSVCVSFRNDHMTDEEQLAVVRSLKNALALLPIKPKLAISVQVDKDAAFANRLRKELFDWAPELYHSHSINSLSNFYKDFDIIVSNRLHVLLLAGLNGVLPLAYVNENTNSKIIGLFKGLNLNDLIVLNKTHIELDTVFDRREDLANIFHLAAKQQRELLGKRFNNAVEA